MAIVAAAVLVHALFPRYEWLLLREETARGAMCSESTAGPATPGIQFLLDIGITSPRIAKIKW